MQDGPTKEKDASATEAIPGSDTKHIGSQDADDDVVGRTIEGKYEVEKLIGAGGMGKVYRGRNKRTDSPVAIKTLIPDLISDESLVKRFEIEAKAASNLRHPNTIRIYDFGREGDMLFMVMELLDGYSLEGLLARDGRVAPGRLVKIIMQTCRSLAEAHASGLVHRDIKPDNLFLNQVGTDEDEHVKVLDFGVAKLKDNQFGQATLTQAGMIFGTPRYMSPEQARAFELDGRSDIYALGVIMFECLTGVPPFEANDPVGVLVKHVNEPIPTFAEVNPDMEPVPELEAITRRCMQKDPDERFDDVHTLLNAVEAVASRYAALPPGHTDPALRSSAQTVAIAGEGGPEASAQISTDVFETLGVSTNGDDSGAVQNKSRYTLGASRQEMASGEQPVDVRQRSTVIYVAIALGLLLVVAGVGIASLVRPKPTDPATTTDVGAAVEADATPEPTRVDASPVITVAQLTVGPAVGSALERASSFVVPITLEVNREDARAFASLDGSDDAPVALPYTFFFVRDPALPGETTLKFVVMAEGYRTTTHEVPLRPTEGPVTVSLRRHGSGGTPRDSGGVAVPQPPRRDSGPGGLADPYER